MISQNFNSNQELDSRCFLNGGGSTLSFFVKESLPISSIVGRLDIQGDTDSDIELILGKYIKTTLIIDQIKFILIKFTINVTHDITYLKSFR